MSARMLAKGVLSQELCRILSAVPQEGVCMCTCVLRNQDQHAFILLNVKTSI